MKTVPARMVPFLQVIPKVKSCSRDLFWLVDSLSGSQLGNSIMVRSGLPKNFCVEKPSFLYLWTRGDPIQVLSGLRTASSEEKCVGFSCKSCPTYILWTASFNGTVLCPKGHYPSLWMARSMSIKGWCIGRSERYIFSSYIGREDAGCGNPYGSSFVSQPYKEPCYFNISICQFSCGEV